MHEGNLGHSRTAASGAAVARPNPARWPFGSFRVRVVLMFGAATLALAVLLSVLAGVASRHRIMQSTSANMVTLAYQLANKLDQGMYERYQDVAVVAELIADGAGRLSEAEQRAALELLQAAFPDYSWIGLAAPDGTVLAATGGLLEGEDVSARPWFIAGQQGPFVGDVHEALLLEALLVPPGGGPLRLIDISRPIHAADGELRAVLGAHLNWAWAEGIYASLLSPAMQTTQIELFIVGADGAVLLGPADEPGQPPAAVLALLGTGRSGSAVATWDDGVTYLTGYAHTGGYADYPGLGWQVITRQPAALAFAPARQLVAQLLLTGVALGGVFVVIGWMLAGHITRPLEQITAAAAQIRQGHTTAAIPTLNTTGEIASLSASLGAMVATLRDEVATRQAAQVDLEASRDALRESEARLRTMLETAAQGIVLVNAHGEITLVNRYIEDAFQVGREALLGQPVEVLVPAARGAAHAAEREQYIQQPTRRPMGAEREVVAARADGTTFPVEVSLTPLNVGGVPHVMAFLVDITERKQLEAQQLYAAQLEADLAREREVRAVRERMLSMMSHEFRTPLSIIQASVSFVTHYFDRLPPERILNKLHGVQPQIQRMVNLMEDALLFNRSQANRTPFRPVAIPVAAFIAEVVGPLRELDAGAHTVEVVASDGNLHADPRLLEHVFTNLVTNALKYSPAGTTVTLTANQYGAAWHFTVRDEGRGIPPEDLPGLFEPFARAANVGSTPGTGLGLVIVKTYVQMHGGVVTVESTLDAGTTFTVVIPDAPAYASNSE